MALSQDWRPVASHSSFYTGGAIIWNEKANAIFGLSSECVVVFRDECVVASMESEGDGVMTFAVSPDGATVVTSHRSTLLRQWTLSEDKWTCVHSWRGHSDVISDLAFDSKGRFLASGGLDRLVKVWDFEGRFVTHNFQGHATIVTLVRFRPERLQVISIGEDAEIRVWDMQQNTLIACLKDHLSRISCVTFFSQKEEDLMVSGGRDSIVNIWSLQNFTLKTTIPVFESVEGVVVFKDENRDFNLLTVGDKGLVRLWDDKGKCLTQIESPHGVKGAMRKAFKVRWKNADAIATIGEDRHIIFWNLSLKIVARFMTHCEDVIHCQFAGARLLVVGSDESPLIVDPSSFRVHSMLRGHSQGILAAHAQENRVCTAGKDHEIRVWDDKGKCHFLMKGHAGDVTAVLLPHNLKKHRLLISGSADKTLKLWALPEEGESMIEVRSSKLTKVEHSKDIMCLAMPLNDKMLASGSQDKVIKIFSFPDFEVLGECKGHRRGIWSMQFSPRDKVLASASGDATIRLWNLTDFSAIKAFEGHAGAVLQVRFLANAMQLMSSGSDGLLKLWNIRTTDCVKTFEKHDDKVWGMDITGERMVSGGDTLIVWEDCSAEAVQEEEIRQADMRIKDSKIAAHLQKKEYSSALTLALELGKLGQLKSTLEIWALEGLEQTNSKVALKDWVESLSAELIEKLLKDVLVKWNTNGRTAHLANLLLRYCLPRIDMRMEGLNTVTDAFTAYGDRHLQRWDQICQQTFMIDLLLQGSTQTLPQAAADTAKVLFENGDLSPRASVPLIPGK
eukprot:GEMP01014670.1.p1 GENE.GEMP01014670.1~~GEMP01014670.1.p1  ORF type:complete len:802 (+),score=147.51 GEMP01014670.1:44-2407(+)